MSLRSRFLILIAAFCVVVAAPSWLVVRLVTESIVEKWALRVTEKQVLYDKNRSLAPILREVALAKKLAVDPGLLRWAKQPNNAALERSALAKLERSRRSFQDESYFVGLLRNGHYYHNNASGDFTGKELRYTLNVEAPKDAWFYDLIKQNDDIHVNVNPDEELGVVKLWIDVLFRGEDGKALGVVGTGLDLTNFMNEMEAERSSGFTSLFVDHDGVIQLHRSRTSMDYGTVSERKEQKKTIKAFLQNGHDLKAVQKSMASLQKQSDAVGITSATISGERHFVGVAYLPELGWYEITLFDLGTLLPGSQFFGLLLVYAVVIIGLLLLSTLALQRYVLTPIHRLEHAITQMEAGESVDPALAKMGTGEIRRLMERFVRLSSSTASAQQALATRVQECTVALDQLTKSDSLTELLNRRGMWERLETEFIRSSRESCTVGVLRIDIDAVKKINDDYGHDVGDRVIKAVAHLIERQLRSYDSVARWDGGGFLVLLTNMNQKALDDLGERLRAKAESCNLVRTPAGEMARFTVSVGGHLQREGDTIDSLLRSADLALLSAKERGHNRYCSSLGECGGGSAT